MLKVVIGVTSLARAGKDTFADYIVKKYGYKKFNMSDVLKEELIKQGKEPTKNNMSLLGDELRKKFGEDIVMKMLFDRIIGEKKVVITGIRSLKEIVFIRTKCDYFFLVAIEANKEIRFSRRKENDPQTKKEFFARDERDIKNKGLGEVIELADYKIINNGTLEEFYKNIDKVMEEIESKIKNPPPYLAAA